MELMWKRSRSFVFYVSPEARVCGFAIMIAKIYQNFKLTSLLIEVNWCVWFWENVNSEIVNKKIKRNFRFVLKLLNFVMCKMFKNFSGNSLIHF